MTPEEQSEVKALLASIPPLAGYKGEIQRLGGLTNRVYALGDLVLRIPGRGTEEYISRKNELVMAKEAAHAGVSPALIYGDDRTGVMVTARIDDARARWRSEIPR